MPVTELTKKLTIVNKNGEEKQITLYTDYTLFDDYDFGTYIAVQTDEGIGYIYCNSSIMDDKSEQFASFIDKKGKVRYAYLTSQENKNRLIAKYTFNSNTDTVPTFDSGYTYTTKDTVNSDGTTTREIKSGSLPMSMSFSAKKGLKTVEYLNTSKLTNMSNIFGGCSALISIDTSSFNTSNTTNMSNMFSGCSSLTSLDVSNFDTSNVTNMIGMFRVCSSLTTLSLPNFNTSNVTSMTNMFYSCTALTSIDVSSFDTSKVTNMANMFRRCGALTSLNLSNFNTSIVTNMGTMFGDCTRLMTLDLTSFDTAKVTSMSNMLSNVPSEATISVSNTFTISETDCNWTGTFTRI